MSHSQQRRAAASTGIVGGLVLLSGLAWTLLGWQTTPDKVPETLHPAKPIAVYVWDGFQAHQKSWDATAAQQALVESGLLKTVNRLLDFVVSESGEEGAVVAKKLFGRLFERGFSFSATIEPGQEVTRKLDNGSIESVSTYPAPQVTLLLHGSADLEPKLAALLAGPLQAAKAKQETIGKRKVTRIDAGELPLPPASGFVWTAGDYELGWWVEGGHLVIVGGLHAIQSAIDIADGKAPNLTSNPDYKKLRTAKDFDVAAVSLLDLKSLLGLFSDWGIPRIPGSDNEPGRISFGQILEETGLDGVGQLQGRWGFKGPAIWSETVLQAPAPRTGIPGLFDQKLLTLKDLPPFPKGCENFSVMQFDVSRFATAMLRWANQAHDEFAPAGAPRIKELRAKFQEEFGFELIDDLLDPLGDTFAGFVDPAASGLVPAGALLVDVDDSKKLGVALQKLEEILTKVAGENAKFRTKDVGGRTIHTVQFAGPVAFFSPSWVLDQGWLVIGSTPQTVEAQLKRMDGKLPHWEASPEIAAGLQQLPEKFSSFGYSDPRSGLRSLINLAPTGISLAELGIAEWRKERQRAGKPVDESAEFPISGDDIPPSEEITGPLFPNLSVGTFDDAGIRWYTRNSLPGIPIPGLGGGGGVESAGTVAVLVALLLPAVQQAREAARRTKSKNNLRQMALALHNFHDANSQLPTGTIPNPKLKPDERLSWMVEILPYIEQEALNKLIDRKQGWNDKGHEVIKRTVVSLFQNPAQSFVPPQDAPGVTHYVGIAGIGKDAPTLPITDDKVGMFGYDRVTRFRDVSDGLSNTMMITDASKDFGPWAQGGKSTLRSLTTKPYINGPDGIGSPHVGIIQVLMGDGSVRAIRTDINPETFEALSTIHGGEELGDF